MTKEKTNLTLSREIRDILRQAKKLSKSDPSISKLVEYAVKKTYKNKKEVVRDEMRFHQRQLMSCKDQLKVLLEEEKEKEEI